MVFVNVHHEISANSKLAIKEEHDIVYREMPEKSDLIALGISPPIDATWTREIVPDDVLLFRYSALTFNSHRIHYDRRYVTQVEGYPGLIVHGPLIATLLLDLIRREMPEASLKKFSFKALKPIFDISPFKVCGRLDSDRKVKLWATTLDGFLAMDAEVEIN